MSRPATSNLLVVVVVVVLLYFNNYYFTYFRGPGAMASTSPYISTNLDPSLSLKLIQLLGRLTFVPDLCAVIVVQLN